MVTQYIGARYVQVFADPAEWSSEKEYEPLTVVLHEGNSFTSKQFVPVGIDINNEKYWAETGNYNAQVEAYRREAADARDYATDVANTLPISEFDEVTVKDYIDNISVINNANFGRNYIGRIDTRAYTSDMPNRCLPQCACLLDSKTMVQFFANEDDTNNLILTIDLSTGTILQKTIKQIGHCNDASYDYIHNVIYLATGIQKIIRLNPITFNIIDELVTAHPVQRVEYVEDENCIYYVDYGCTTYKFYLTDNSEEQIINVSMEVLIDMFSAEIGNISGEQGMCYYDGKLYYLFSQQNTPCMLVVLTIKNKKLNIITLPKSCFYFRIYEDEGICCSKNGTIYVTSRSIADLSDQSAETYLDRYCVIQTIDINTAYTQMQNFFNQTNPISVNTDIDPNIILSQFGTTEKPFASFKEAVTAGKYRYNTPQSYNVVKGTLYLSRSISDIHIIISAGVNVVFSAGATFTNVIFEFLGESTVTFSAGASYEFINCTFYCQTSNTTFDGNPTGIALRFRGYIFFSGIQKGSNLTENRTGNNRCAYCKVNSDMNIYNAIELTA